MAEDVMGERGVTCFAFQPPGTTALDTRQQLSMGLDTRTCDLAIANDPTFQ